MQESQRRALSFGTSAIIWMGLIILLVGVGFVVAYHGLRGSTKAVAVESPAAGGAAAVRDNPLSDLGIDPEASGLSPAATAAIARAHRAAIEAAATEGKAVSETAPPAPDGDAVPADETVPADSALPMDEAAPADEAVPMDETVPAEEGVPTDDLNR